VKKSGVLIAIQSSLEARCTKLVAASEAARAEATHEDNQSESKYDTRSIEAGYLANGQARKAEEAAHAVLTYDALQLREFDDETPIALTALVELRLGANSEWFFIGPEAGGLEVEVDGKEITVISAETPLAQQMIGKRKGQSTTRPPGTILTVL